MRFLALFDAMPRALAALAVALSIDFEKLGFRLLPLK
jgi:hypothetical protein